MKIRYPAKLCHLIAHLLLDKEEWLSADTDIKGNAHEGTLQKRAEELKEALVS